MKRIAESLRLALRTIDQRAVALVSAKLGRCPICWRLSFQGAAVGWVVVLILHLIGVDTRLLRPLMIWPLAFSTLWLLHIAVYGIRVVTWMRRASDPYDQVVDRPEDGNRGSSSWGYSESSTVTRRRMLHAFLRNAGWAVLASFAVPMMSACSSASTDPCKDCRTKGGLCCILSNSPSLISTFCCPSGAPFLCGASCSAVPNPMCPNNLVCS
jgi:hypothetical protein